MFRLKESFHDHISLKGNLKVAKVVPIFKARMKDDPTNYRPISILSSVARVFEKIICDQLYHYFNSNNLLGKQQWNFRKLHSTVLALQSTTNNWLLNMDNNRANAVIFPDLKKLLTLLTMISLSRNYIVMVFLKMNGRFLGHT